MLHVVCDCGALISVSPPPGPRSARCRACGAVVSIPDPAVLGIAAAAVPDPAPAPAPVPGDAAPQPEPQPGVPVPEEGGRLPSFQTDERLDLRALERQAAVLGVLERISLLGGLVAVAGVAAAPGLSPALRIALGCAAMLAGLVGWASARGARRAATASVALAERQRELLRGLVRR